MTPLFGRSSPPGRGEPAEVPPQLTGIEVVPTIESVYRFERGRASEHAPGFLVAGADDDQWRAVSAERGRPELAATVEGAAVAALAFFVPSAKPGALATGRGSIDQISRRSLP